MKKGFLGAKVAHPDILLGGHRDPYQLKNACITLAKQEGFHQVWYQGGVKATVSGVVEDLKFKISEGSDKNWSAKLRQLTGQSQENTNLRQLTGQCQENTNLGPNLLKF